VETIQSRLQEDESEKEEQQRRKNNVIVFGLNESSSDDAAVRVADDVEKVESVVNQLQLSSVPDVTKVVRLGKKPEEEDEKPRPLLVSFRSEEAKAELLKKAKNLKDMREGGLDKVFIYQDLMPKQREVRKKLVAELKSRQTQGESGLIIVGTKIVKRTR